jgi:hypothetical protein
MSFCPFNFTCPRDLALTEMLVRSWERFRSERWTIFHEKTEPIFGPSLEFFMAHGAAVRERSWRFAPWNGWMSAMSKFDGWLTMAENETVADYDYIVHVDSDAIFHSPDILWALTGDFAGFPHSEKLHVPSIGREWTWKSGCFQAARAWVVRKLARLTSRDLEAIEQEMRGLGLQLIDDVVMSFMFAKVGATEQDLPPELFESDPAGALSGEVAKPRSFTHLNGDWTSFLGVKIPGKWGIPQAIAERGITI